MYYSRSQIDAVGGSAQSAMGNGRRGVDGIESGHVEPLLLVLFDFAFGVPTRIGNRRAGSRISARTVHYFIGQRETVGRDDQRYHHEFGLKQIGPFLPQPDSAGLTSPTASATSLLLVQQFVHSQGRYYADPDTLNVWVMRGVGAHVNAASCLLGSNARFVELHGLAPQIA